MVARASAILMPGVGAETHVAQVDEASLDLPALSFQLVAGVILDECPGDLGIVLAQWGSDDIVEDVNLGAS